MENLLFPKEAEVKIVLSDLPILIAEALAERSQQAQKVLQLQLFIEKAHPEILADGKHVIDAVIDLLCAYLKKQ